MIPDAKSHFEVVKPTYMENWPRLVHALSIPSMSVGVTLTEARALGTNIVEYGDAFGPDMEDIAWLSARIDKAMKALGGEKFLVRLGSRSPKDTFCWETSGGRVRNGRQAVLLLCDCSERIADDLGMALAMDYPPVLWVRQWREIPRWAEFRCFQRGGRFIGASQYFYRETFPEIVERGPEILAALAEFHDTFRRAWGLSDCVFDVWYHDTTPCDGDQAARVDERRVTLIEVNPFFELTDPCLFEWADLRERTRPELRRFDAEGIVNEKAFARYRAVGTEN